MICYIIPNNPCLCIRMYIQEINHMKVDSYTIAKMVGVSQATVSRAFSNPEKVSEKTRKKIMDVADSLGYKPDKNASALRRKGTNNIILLYINRDKNHYWMTLKRNYWIFAEAVLALTNFFEDQHYSFEVKMVDSLFTVKEKEIKDHCDGILVFDFVTEEEAQFVDSWNIPYIFCQRSIHLDKFNHSATDNRSGGVLQAEYLKSRNCRKPVYIMNEEDPFSHHLRKEGFASVYPRSIIINEEETGKTKEKLISLIRSDQIDGIAFINDMLLVKMTTQLFQEKLDLQKMFPLVGYDNSTELQVLDRKPATIEIGISEIYSDAAEHLLKLISKDVEDVKLVHKPQLLKEV